MANRETTGLTVEFSSEARNGASFRLENSRREPPGDNKAYFLVFPGSAGVSLTPTSGSIRKSNPGLSKYVETFVSFDNSTSAGLSHPSPNKVTYSLVGKALGRDGEPTTAVVSYDASKNSLRASRPITAIYKVVYEAPYDLWEATFSGNCPSVPPKPTNTGPEDDSSFVGYDPMAILGIKGEDRQTLSLTAPECEYPGDSDVAAGFSTGSDYPHIVLEIDPDEPPRLNPVSSETVKAQCGVRVYPSADSLLVNRGTMVKKSQEADAQFENVKEAITFSGGSSASLRYIPQGRPAVTPQGSFIDQWGSSFTPRIYYPGDTITVVDWQARNTYSNPRPYVVRENEVMVGDLFGNAVPCYGLANVSYTVKFEKYRYTFDGPLENSDGSHRFGVGYAVALFNGYPASLQIQPPPLRGNR